jgi:hypothetical protein
MHKRGLRIAAPGLDVYAPVKAVSLDRRSAGQSSDTYMENGGQPVPGSCRKL